MKPRSVKLLLVLFILLTGCSGTGHEGKTHSDYPVWGIDISKHQGTVDWKTVCKHNRPHFVFLKATEGTLIADPTYERNAKKLDEFEILRGAYHFFGHRTPGKEQAKKFISTAKLGKGNLYPVLDIEKHRFMTDPKKTVKEAKAFCREIKKHYGVNPVIYCSTNFYKHYLQKDFPQKDYIFWIADYSKNPGHLYWDFWQHTESHTMRGVKGKVDRNVFAGRPEDLAKFVLK